VAIGPGVGIGWRWRTRFLAEGVAGWRASGSAGRRI